MKNDEYDYEYSENKYVLKYEYDYFRMYSCTSTITLECNHLITFMTTLMIILFLP